MHADTQPAHTHTHSGLLLHEWGRKGLSVDSRTINVCLLLCGKKNRQGSVFKDKAFVSVYILALIGQHDYGILLSRVSVFSLCQWRSIASFVCGAVSVNVIIYHTTTLSPNICLLQLQWPQSMSCHYSSNHFHLSLHPPFPWQSHIHEIVIISLNQCHHPPFVNRYCLQTAFRVDSHFVATG